MQMRVRLFEGLYTKNDYLKFSIHKRAQNGDKSYRVHRFV